MFNLIFRSMAVVLASSLMIRFWYKLLVVSSISANSLSVSGLRKVGADSAISPRLLGGDLSRGTSRMLTTDSIWSSCDNSVLRSINRSIFFSSNKSPCGLIVTTRNSSSPYLAFLYFCNIASLHHPRVIKCPMKHLAQSIGCYMKKTPILIRPIRSQ